MADFLLPWRTMSFRCGAWVLRNTNQFTVNSLQRFIAWAMWWSWFSWRVSWNTLLPKTFLARRTLAIGWYRRDATSSLGNTLLANLFLPWRAWPVPTWSGVDLLTDLLAFFLDYFVTRRTRS